MLYVCLKINFFMAVETARVNSCTVESVGRINFKIYVILKNNCVSALPKVQVKPSQWLPPRRRMLITIPTARKAEEP